MKVKKLSGLPRLRPLSLTKKLAMLIAIAYIVPILFMTSLLQQFVTEQFDQQVTEKVELSFHEISELAVTYLEFMIESSRRLTYDGSVDRAYAQYLLTGSESDLYNSTNSSLNGSYKYNSLCISAALFYHDKTLSPHFVSNDNMRDLEEVAVEYALIRGDLEEISDKIGSGIGFYSLDNQLFLLRNLQDSRYKEYGLLVLEVNAGRVLGAFQGVTGMYSVEIAYDEASVSGGPMVYLEDFTEMKYKTKVERHDIEVTLWVDVAQGGDVLDLLTQKITQVSLLIVPSLAYMLFNFYRHITRPLEVLLEAQKKVERGHLGFQVEKQPSSREFEALTHGFNMMSSSMKEQFQQSYREQLALQDARMKSLQSQINPHFLNNTLEIINWETRMAGNANASAMIESLSVMLRATMDREGKGKIPFRQELTFVDAYLFIQSCRMGKRLTLEQCIEPDTLDVLVPRLAFQPIVENAFEHGIKSQKEGEIIISTYYAHQILILEVKNSGCMSEEDQERIKVLLEWDEKAKDYTFDSSSLGVRNVNQRVKMMYGEQYGLDIFNNDSNQTVARLALPVHRDF